MHVTLLHNPDAGDGGTAKRTLRRLVEDAGHEVTYRSTRAKGWKRAVREVRDVALVVGGDGTVAKVARRLAGRERPMAIVATGTANNVARAIGAGDDAARVVAGLAHGREHRIDVGRVRGSPGRTDFIESVGVGLVAALIAGSEDHPALQDASPEEELHHARLFAADLLGRLPAERCRLVADGKDLTGDYLLVEVMNIPSAGPRLALAPTADPTDGLLDVVALPANSRDAAREAVLAGQPFDDRVPAVRARAACVELGWWDTPLHIDADLWTPRKPRLVANGASSHHAVLRVDRGSVRVLRTDHG